MGIALCHHAVMVATAILLLLPLSCTCWITVHSNSNSNSHNKNSNNNKVVGQLLHHRTTTRQQHRQRGICCMHMHNIDQNRNDERNRNMHRSFYQSSSSGSRGTHLCLAAQVSSSSSSSSSVPLNQPDEDNYQAIGETIIRQAGVSCGANDLQIEWSSSGTIKVVVHGDAFVSNPMGEGGDANDDDDDAILMEMEEDINEEDDNVDDELDIDDGDEDDDSTTTDSIADVDDIGEESSSRGVDVVALARAINAALADDTTGLWIAETHEIEVTTPGAPDELTGIMWKVYKGFPVICRHQDPKTKQQKTIEGRLHERTDEFTVINIKGRMKKLKNIDVLSVKLPKAKKEKGA